LVFINQLARVCNACQKFKCNYNNNK